MAPGNWNIRLHVSRLPVALVILLLLLFSPAFALDFLYPAEVERVVDGETVVADLYLGLGVILDDQYIRLHGIDAWETRGEERPKGLLAKEYLTKRLEERKVDIEIRPGWANDGKGKYGRWLGVVYVDGTDVNEEMVRVGRGGLKQYG